MLVKSAGILALLMTGALLVGSVSAAAPGDVDRLLEEGWRSYSTGDWDVAEASFLDVESQRALSPEQRFSAVLGLATTYHLQPNPDVAAATRYYGQLAALDMEKGRRLSMLGLAQIDRTQGRRNEALAKLEQLRSTYPEALEADEATVQIAEIMFAPVPSDDEPGGHELPAGVNVRRGMRTLEQWLEVRPQNPLASLMHRLLAANYIQAGDYATAVQNLEQAMDLGVLSARSRATVLWQIARIAEMQLHDYALAERYYERFTDEAKRHVLHYRATQSLERVRRLKEQQADEQG